MTYVSFDHEPVVINISALEVNTLCIYIKVSYIYISSYICTHTHSHTQRYTHTHTHTHTATTKKVMMISAMK